MTHYAKVMTDGAIDRLSDKPFAGAVEVGDEITLIHRRVDDEWVIDTTLKTKRREGEFRDFMKFFTETERLAIVSATLANPQIKLWYDTAMGGAKFSLDHPETVNGLSALVSAGLLTETRSDQIQNGDFDLVE